MGHYSLRILLEDVIERETCFANESRDLEGAKRPSFLFVLDEAEMIYEKISDY